MGNNWIELGLTKDEEELVRKGAELWGAIYLDTIDNVFVIARAIETLRKRYEGMGVKGAFGDALVQYKYTARDGESPIDKAIRSNLSEMLRNEKQVRDWWKTVPEKRKRHWVSAPTIYKHWNKARKPVDPNAPKKPSPLAREKATSQLLQEQLREANTRLKTADGGNLFDLEQTGAEKIGEIIVAAWRMQPSRIRTLITTLSAELKELEARIKTARPLGGLPGRRTRHGKVVKS
jgi:hypothetical protein